MATKRDVIFIQILSSSSSFSISPCPPPFASACVASPPPLVPSPPPLKLLAVGSAGAAVYCVNYDGNELHLSIANIPPFFPDASTPLTSHYRVLHDAQIRTLTEPHTHTYTHTQTHDSVLAKLNLHIKVGGWPFGHALTFSN